MHIRLPLAAIMITALWLGLAISAKGCNPFPGWMPQDFPNKHRPEEK